MTNEREKHTAPHDFALDYTELARALCRDVESAYYVDLETDDYLEYVSDGSYELLQLETSGRNFFRECRRNVQHVVFNEDSEKVLNALDKYTLVTALRERGIGFTESMTYPRITGRTDSLNSWL